MNENKNLKKFNEDTRLNYCIKKAEEDKKIIGFNKDDIILAKVGDYVYEIGKYTYEMPDIKWKSDNAKFKCGKFCSIAMNVKVYLGGNHRVDYVTTYPFGHVNQHIFNLHDGNHHPSTKGDVIIGNDVWVGDNTTIMSGVTIGDGAVVANNSHVVKSIEPYAIYGGNPAKFIKYRFSKEQIEKLLEIKWWDWDDEKINKSTSLLCSDNIDDFINYATSS